MTGNSHTSASQAALIGTGILGLDQVLGGGGIRSFPMDSAGVHVGKPLREFRGILTGEPVPHENPQHASP